MSLKGNVIGLVEDDPIMGESLALSLSLEGCDVRWWKTGAEALSELPYANASAVVCDIRLPDMDGSAVFSQTRRQRRSTPFLFMTAYGSVEQAVELIKQGAGDYLTKPFEMPMFLEKLGNLLQEDELSGGHGVLGQSREIEDIEAFLRQIAHTDLPVLFHGETGVGKEVCARFLHGLRADEPAPFMALNCAAIPSALLERELLGAETSEGDEGDGLHRGYAERAANGTLFLDEVDELPLHLQAKLLRFIEDNAFYRIGGQELVPMRCRIMCATLADLEQRVSQGQFRKDLFYRINSASVYVPPLRQRAEDIHWLIEHFLADLTEDRQPRQLTPAAQQAMQAHSWPGNVRELRNRIARAVAVSSDAWIGPDELFPDSAGSSEGELGIRSLAKAREEAEKKQIEFALQSKEGRISAAARALGISRTTMWEKMAKYQIAGTEP